ncbi:MAG TPA: glycoside hydrolase family 57 protein [Acidobacteriota bacterium]|nr:glycoside hydrolase family 57 protein [Acidobacteriota bacterium]
MSKRCYLIIYLHMHQPFYKNLRTGEYMLPWVRLHALRNYADIPSLQQKYEGIKITYNLVPSLVEQIQDYASGATDHFERMSRMPADELLEEDKRFILSNFFQLNHRQIKPVPRFRELLMLKGDQSREVDDKALKRFGPAEFRDLQVLFNLAWSGWLLREQPAVASLLKKARNFTEAEKLSLLDAQRKFLGEVLEPYKRLRDSGAGEVTTSPYFHPILPLLCDLESAREAVPGLQLPETSFRRPDDAARQIKEGIRSYIQLFGEPPQGIWPSEGSVSMQACELIAAAGLRWAGSDRTVLANSLGREPGELHPRELYTPHVLTTPAGELALFFRDTELSDLPAFVYQSWPAEKAVDDFLKRLKAVAESGEEGRVPVVSVILDGENAWAAYPDNGRQFFEELFSRLQATEWLETITPSEALEREDIEKRRLDRVTAGSWIYGTLTTWIGHPEKNRGWEVLAPARDKLDETAAGNDLELAWREMLVAEGSDWFWWYGDDHSTAFAAEFDVLFREHVSNVYRDLDIEPPNYLLKPIMQLKMDSEITPPLRHITPKLDGRESSYSEWVNAGCYSTLGGAGMQHQTSSLLKTLYFGFDKANFYLRIDGREPFRKKPLDGKTLRVYITAPVTAEISYKFGSGKPPCFKRDGEEEAAELLHGFDSILEMALPQPLINGGDTLAFYLSLADGDNELERHPRGRLIELRASGDDLESQMWTV